MKTAMLEPQRHVAPVWDDFGDTAERRGWPYARLGAVTARMTAREPIRVLDLAERYLEEPISEKLRARLVTLRGEASASLVGTAEVVAKFYLAA